MLQNYSKISLTSSNLTDLVQCSQSCSQDFLLFFQTSPFTRSSVSFLHVPILPPLTCNLQLWFMCRCSFPAKWCGSSLQQGHWCTAHLSLLLFLATKWLSQNLYTWTDLQKWMGLHVWKGVILWLISVSQ